MKKSHIVLSLISAFAFAAPASAVTLTVGTETFTGSNPGPDIRFSTGGIGFGTIGISSSNSQLFEINGGFTEIKSTFGTFIRGGNANGIILDGGIRGTNITGSSFFSDVTRATLLSDESCIIGALDGNTQVASGADIIIRAFDMDPSDNEGPGNVSIAGSEVAIDADITTISGAVVLTGAQGDISMGIFGN